MRHFSISDGLLDDLSGDDAEFQVRDALQFRRPNSSKVVQAAKKRSALQPHVGFRQVTDLKRSWRTQSEPWTVADCANRKNGQTTPRPLSFSDGVQLDVTSDRKCRTP